MIGANFSFGRIVPQRIGAFDIRFGAGAPLHAAEETDFVYRAFRAGIPVRYEPSAVVWHDHRRDTATLRRMIYRYHVSEGALALKHFHSDGGRYLRSKYWGIVSEFRSWRQGDRTLGQVLLHAAAHLEGAARMALSLGLDRLRGHPARSPEPTAAVRPADGGRHA